DWSRISTHRNITLQMILKHPKLNWDWDRLSLNPNITVKMIKEHELEFHRMKDFDDSQTVTEMIEHYSYLKNFWYRLSYHPNLTIEILSTHSHSLDLLNVCSNPNITIDMISRQFEHWHWYCSYSSNLTMEKILHHPNKKWNWDCISIHPKLSLEVILKHYSQ